LLDDSYSMKEKMFGHDTKQKTYIAESIIERVLARLPIDVNCGLRVFGNAPKSAERNDHDSNLNSSSSGNGFDCHATELLVPIKNRSRLAIITAVRNIKPFGNSPIEFALREAYEKDLADISGRTVIVLITDGLDTCGGDPAHYLRDSSNNYRAEIVAVSFIMGDRTAARQLDQMVLAGHGRLYDQFDLDQLFEDVGKAGKQQTNKDSK